MILRKATADDAHDVWRWRQDRHTRAMSRSSEETPLEAHRAWFARALIDPSRTLLIGEDAGAKVGMVRFDRGAVTEVSINVNPELRGRGYGQALLDAALATEPGEVWAEIKDENLASRRIFARAGFEHCGTEAGLGRYVRPSGTATR